MNDKKYKQWLSILARYLIGFVIVFWLLHANLISLDVLGLIHLRVALIASVLILIQLLLAAWRVQLLLARHDIHVGLWRSLAYNVVGIFYSLFLPGGISGDLARAYCFWRAYPESSKSALFGALFIDRLLGTIAMIVMGLVAGTFLMSTLGLQRFMLSSWGLFIVLAGGYFLMTRLHHKGDKTASGFVGRIMRFVEKIDLQGYGFRLVFISSVLSLAGHLCAVFVIYLFSNLMQSGLHLLQVMAVAPLGLLANALPLTPGGIGIGEKGFEVLYQLAGGSQGGNSFLLSRVFLFSPACLGALVLCYQFVRAQHLMFSKYLRKK